MPFLLVFGKLTINVRYQRFGNVHRKEVLNKLKFNKVKLDFIFGINRKIYFSFLYN